MTAPTLLVTLLGPAVSPSGAGPVTRFDWSMAVRFGPGYGLDDAAGW